MKRRLFLTGTAFSVVEVVFDAVLLFLFFNFGEDEAIAAFVALVPALALSSPYWLLFSSRWLRGLEGDRGPEVARDVAARYPRRTLVYRTALSFIVAVLLAPALAGIVGVAVGEAFVIIGTVTTVAFSMNVVRAFVYRRVLEPHARELYADEPLRYAARCLRERLFVSTNLVGTCGVTFAVFYMHFVVGVPTSDFAGAFAIAPLVLVVTAGFAAWDMLRVTAPLLRFLVPARYPGEAILNAGTALKRTSAAPFRLAWGVLVSWILAATLAALYRRSHGGLPGEPTQVFAGMIAVGTGIVVFQASWHRRILAPVHEAAAQQLLESDSAFARTRLSLRAKLAFAFLVIVGFGGTFAFLTALNEHERLEAASAGTRALLLRDRLLASPGLDGAAARARPGEALGRVEDHRAFLIVDQRGFGAALPPEAVADALRSPAGVLRLPHLRQTAAFATVAPGVRFGVVEPWLSADGQQSVGALLFVFAALAFACAGAVYVAVQEITAPVVELARRARQFGRGDFSRPVVPTDSDELGELAAALETARRELQARLRSIEDLNASLERRVSERTAQLEQANTELTQAMAALSDANEQIVKGEKMASLGRLVAGIAHEINNPLNFVQNALPPLRQAFDSMRKVADALPRAPEEAAKLRTELQLDSELDDARELLRVMDNGVARMNAIVRALRDFSRQSPDGKPEPVDLERLVDDAAALLRHDLKGRVELVKDLAARAPVLGEPGPLAQVFVNLLKNAAQAIEGPGTITVSSADLPGAVEVRVADTGKGMTPVELKRVFEPFFTTKPVGVGTGLGLAIVHGILEKHGGKIEVKSSPGSGTEFRMVLPIR